MKKTIAFLMFLILGVGFSIVSAQTETTGKKISVGVLNGKALSLPKPAYPAAARAVNASGAVNVQVMIDEQGNVVSADAVSGHPLLRATAIKAALESKFSPTALQGQPVKVTGVIVYNFVGTPDWLSEGFSLGIAENKGIRGQINLPEEFSSEQAQLDAIAKLPVEEQKSQIPASIFLIRSKLSGADLWRFEFGLAKGGVLSNYDTEASLLLSLAKFKELAVNKAEGLQTYEINRAVELAKYADKGSLTSEDKQAILSYLK